MTPSVQLGGKSNDASRESPNATTHTDRVYAGVTGAHIDVLGVGLGPASIGRVPNCTNGEDWCGRGRFAHHRPFEAAFAVTMITPRLHVRPPKLTTP